MNKKLNRGIGLRGSLLWIIIIVVIVLYLGYRTFEHKENFTSMSEETLERAVPRVTIVYPKDAEETQAIDLPGNFVAWHQAPIYGRVPGYVKDWYTDYGADVKKGDLLAIIATPILDAEYRMAMAEVKAKEAQYQLAIITAERYVNLGDTKAVSQQSVSVQRANRKVQKAELNKAQQHLKNIQARRHFKRIIAPFDGVVIDRNVNIGDYVNETGSLSLKGADEANLFTVADTTKMRLFVNVPESFGPYLRPGLNAYVTVPQLPGRRFNAEYKTSAKGFNVGTRTAVTQFVIDNKDGEIWPGSFGMVHIKAPVDEGTLVIPITAMVFQEEGSAVALLTEDSTVHIQPMEIVHFNASSLEITGVSKTDRVIDNPSAYLLEGTKVTVINEPAKGYIKSPPGFNFNSPPTEQEQKTPKSGEQGQKTAASSVQSQEAASNSSTDDNMLPYEAGSYRFNVVLEPEKPVVGRNAIVIYLRNEQGQPIQGASIDAVAEMSSADAADAVQVVAKIKEVKPGIYGGVFKLPSEGNWPLVLRFKADDLSEQEVMLDMDTSRDGLVVRGSSVMPSS